MQDLDSLIKSFNTNLTYYNEKDRHEYPKQMVNNNDSSKGIIVSSSDETPIIWCYYNYLEPKSKCWSLLSYKK